MNIIKIKLNYNFYLNGIEIKFFYFYFMKKEIHLY